MEGGGREEYKGAHVYIYFTTLTKKPVISKITRFRLFNFCVTILNDFDSPPPLHLFRWRGAPEGGGGIIYCNTRMKQSESSKLKNLKFFGQSW